MMTQSMRATSAAESRFRIAQPNSRTRKTLVLALGRQALTPLAELQQLSWNNTVMGLYTAGHLELYSGQEARRVPLDDALDQLDVMVLLITSDSDTESIERIGEACSRRRIMTSGFVLEPPDETDLNPVLACTRRVTVSLVTDTDTDTLIESLRAVRA
ncbi:MAG: hypothetical protein ABJ000_04425 [Saccharospirillum sp.]|uniref:hypothetical protein n=1 Tax=Saccharospirillum sp. TaxID=2033801 RepID=UPI003299DEF6